MLKPTKQIGQKHLIITSDFKRDPPFPLTQSAIKFNIIFSEYVSSAYCFDNSYIEVLGNV